MLRNIASVAILLILLIAVGYGLGYVGEAVYNSDSITVER